MGDRSKCPGVVEHPNLVKLVGYCAEDDERGMQQLLVYEYMPNRSVQDHISSRFQIPVPWITRLKIAQDAACGLVYLHKGMKFQEAIIFPISRGSFGPCTDELRGVINIADNEREADWCSSCGSRGSPGLSRSVDEMKSVLWSFMDFAR